MWIIESLLSFFGRIAIGHKKAAKNAILAAFYL